jgi:hypothetical protein
MNNHTIKMLTKVCLCLSMYMVLFNATMYAANVNMLKKKQQPVINKTTPTEQKKPIELAKGGKPAIQKTESIDGQLPVSDVVGQVAQDRQELATLRNTFIHQYIQQGDMKGNCIQLASNITKGTIAYVNKRIAETVKKIGLPPTQFCIFTMGSMARDESGIFTDLEIGILVAKKDSTVLNYFKKFSQVLADRFFLLGEHPDVGGKGFRVDEGRNAPDHLNWYARYASLEQLMELEKEGKEPYQGSRIYVATPPEFANLWSPDFLKYLENLPTMSAKEKDIANAVTSMTRNIRYLYGDNFLLDQYLAAREKYMRGSMLYSNPNYSNRREEIAFFNLEYDVRKHGAPDSAISTGKLGDTFSPKITLYRFPEEVLTSLGFWYNVGVQNSAQIADKLVAMGRMSQQWADALKDLINFAICLRLKKQIAFGKQIFDIPVTQKGYTELKQRFNNRLGTANKNLMAAQMKKNMQAIMQAEEDVLKAQVALKDLEKMAPGKPKPILTPEIIALLNAKYLPIEKKLLEATQKFITGDKNAFLSTDVMPAQPVIPAKPTPAKPVPGKKTPTKIVLPAKKK